MQCDKLVFSIDQVAFLTYLLADVTLNIYRNVAKTEVTWLRPAGRSIYAHIIITSTC